MNKHQLYSLDEILNTGTLFKDIYHPYKKTPKIVSESKEENLLLQIQAYEIALMDLNLYLDIYPNDNSLLTLYNQYTNDKNRLVEEFEKTYYPISKAASAKSNEWKWIEGSWPWENDK